jgi:hypothetical protein
MITGTFCPTLTLWSNTGVPKVWGAPPGGKSGFLREGLLFTRKTILNETWEDIWRNTVWKQVTLELISVSKITWLICSPGFLSIFQKQDKWITHPLWCWFDPKVRLLSLEENYIDIVSDTSLKFSFQGSRILNFGLVLEGISLTSAGKRWTPCFHFQQWHPSKQSIFLWRTWKATLERLLQNSNLCMISYVQTGNHIPPTNPGMKRIFHFSLLN